MGRQHSNLKGGRWVRVRRRVLDRDLWRCQQCGLAGRLEVDHRTPLADGGEVYDPANLQALCRPCHFAKTRAENAARRGTPPAVAKWQKLLEAFRVGFWISRKESTARKGRRFSTSWWPPQDKT